MTEKRILHLLEYSLKNLIENDNELIDRNLKEESINHKLAMYLEKYITESKINILESFPKLSVDIEYNKNNEKCKYAINSNKRMIPDILIHERKTNDNNLVAIECKKIHLNKEDKEKLKNYKKEPYFYEHSIAIEYKPKNKKLKKPKIYDMKIYFFSKTGIKKTFSFNKKSYKIKEYIRSEK